MKERDVLWLLMAVSVYPGQEELTLNEGFNFGKSLLYMTVSMLSAVFLKFMFAKHVDQFHIE